eukprot:284819807_4
MLGVVFYELPKVSCKPKERRLHWVCRMRRVREGLQLHRIWAYEPLLDNLTQVHYFFLPKPTFFYIQVSCLLQVFKYLPHHLKMAVPRFRVDDDIVIHKYFIPQKASEDLLHYLLEKWWCITLKRDFVFVQAVMCHKRCLLLAFRRYLNLVVSFIQIQRCEVHRASPDKVSMRGNGNASFFVTSLSGRSTHTRCSPFFFRTTTVRLAHGDWLDVIIPLSSNSFTTPATVSCLSGVARCQARGAAVPV